MGVEKARFACEISLGSAATNKNEPNQALTALRMTLLCCIQGGTASCANCLHQIVQHVERMKRISVRGSGSDDNYRQTHKNKWIRKIKSELTEVVRENFGECRENGEHISRLNI